ncbi:hypothetical protein SASPL_146099 [Salvia splendens]|uniref:Uncharacterized protein n=1 Tax=Salvia splendens TaxID=180675 RepID=A0A8X8WK14_SALSN|nr:hypothetical protein SASPL_146099 [Salvia splendens]
MITGISSSASGEVNLNVVVMATGIHILCGITFGKRLYAEEWSDTKRFLEFLKGFDSLATSFFVSDYFPAFGLVDWISGKLKRADSIFKGQQKLSYNSSDVAFTPFNEHWKEIRKTTQIHLLGNKRVQSYRHVREEEISRMITEIYSSTSEEVDLSEVVLSTGIRILCRITFGKRYEEGGSERKVFHRILRGFDALATVFFVSNYFPAFGLVDKISGRVKRADVMCKAMDSFYQELIDEHLESKKIKDEEEDMLAVLMKLKNDDESSSGLTWDKIKALLMVSLV